MAVGWADKKLKTIITTRGSTLPGTPCVKKRVHKVMVDGEIVDEHVQFSVPRPQMVEFGFDVYSTIDVHDHFRQGSLRMESGWKTQKWWHRVFASMLGMIATDSYLAYRHDCRRFVNEEDDAYDCFLDFMYKLSYELINNEFLLPHQRLDAGRRRVRRRANANAGNAAAGSDDDDEVG